jgi:hypothetical protein
MHENIRNKINTMEIKEKYQDVGSSIEDALKKTNDINLSGEEENLELNNIRETLKSMNQDFKQEIKKLETSSEWDKFCISFFGETNAGKSTIIESLRIMFDEETRRAEINENKEKYINELRSHIKKYNDIISSLKEINSSIKDIRPKKTVIRIFLEIFILLAFGVVFGLSIGKIIF